MYKDIFGIFIPTKNRFGQFTEKIMIKTTPDIKKLPEGSIYPNYFPAVFSNSSSTERRRSVAFFRVAMSAFSFVFSD